ncbi:hypothetical protein [Lactococcus cremoris]
MEWGSKTTCSYVSSNKKAYSKRKCSEVLKKAIEEYLTTVKSRIMME